jgi:hypothetical protein
LHAVRRAVRVIHSASKNRSLVIMGYVANLIAKVTQ